MYMSRQANKSLEDAHESLKRILRKAHPWMLVPMQEVRPGKGMSDLLLDRFQINPAAPTSPATPGWGNRIAMVSACPQQIPSGARSNRSAEFEPVHD